MNSTREASLILALLLAAAGSTPALGQTAADPDTGMSEAAADAPSIYVVELLIFAYNDFNPYEEEFRPPVPHWPKQLLDVTPRTAPGTLPPGSEPWAREDLLLPAGPGYESGSSAAPATPSATRAADELGNTMSPTRAIGEPENWYRLLDRSELELGRVVTRLNTLEAYTPLVHAGWSQATMLAGEAQPFALGWLGRLQPAGSIRLHRSRFLHLTVDLSLQNDYRYAQAPLPADARWPLAEFVGPVQYRINAQRRVRIGELNFFDHPAFGALIRVKPAPADPAAENASAGPAP